MQQEELIFDIAADPECGSRAAARGEGIFTHGSTLVELKANLCEAIDCYYDALEAWPVAILLHYVR